MFTRASQVESLVRHTLERTVNQAAWQPRTLQSLANLITPLQVRLPSR